MWNKLVNKQEFWWNKCYRINKSSGINVIEQGYVVWIKWMWKEIIKVRSF